MFDRKIMMGHADMGICWVKSLRGHHSSLTVSRLRAGPLVLLLLQRAQLRLMIVLVIRVGGDQLRAVCEVIVEVAPDLFLL